MYSPPPACSDGATSRKTQRLGRLVRIARRCEPVDGDDVLAGVLGLAKLNVQFFPNFALDIIRVDVKWMGAPAEDVESGITIPLEQELRTLDSLNKMTSTSAEGSSTITLEYREGTDMGVALDQVKERVSLLRNLPATSEEPEVIKINRYEPIARLLISGPDNLAELRPIMRQMEDELLEAGIAKITITGLPYEEIAIRSHPSDCENSIYRWRGGGSDCGRLTRHPSGHYRAQ